ncbi:uncharacterized protein LOC110118454 [Ceratitis capitata]|uniref:(Mediterranean fruit fly) hypothetical protein n=1 Tax=Ceratitis capitata TaxID=7213 RepID=A0A811U9N0_CERCA|nr:uncharacterized protein LOC110118454 [Ceratitis capitata]CAD6994045.1 unnamed protein product [Ceratitis capitata]
MNLSFIPGQRGKSLLCFNNFTYAKNNVCGNTTYWNCRSRRVGMKPCKARITTTKQPNEGSVAIYSATSRGRVQLIYGGQPFIFEKILKLATGEEKKFWRCNQWWNQKCRSRVYTINDIVMPLNRYHTHEEIVRRKKRTRRVPPSGGTTSKKEKKTPAIENTSVEAVATTTTDPIDVAELGMHLKYEEIVADVTEIVEPSDIVKKSLK